jgi:hypothetical protein
LSPKTHHSFSEAFDGLSIPLEPARENLPPRLRLFIKRPHLSAVSFLKSAAANDFLLWRRVVFRVALRRQQQRNEIMGI